MKKAIIETEKGDIVLELFPNEAPGTVANFEKLANNSKRNELAFAGEFAYTYFIDRYNFKFISVYNNCGEGQEPSIAKVKSIIDYINNHDIPVVFYEELSEGSVAKMIYSETSAKSSVFYSLHNGNIEEDSYVSLMKNNYKVLEEALN
jgi:ABC-type Zn uptake system ZnuABC Zn-binding protein ZnuA